VDIIHILITVKLGGSGQNSYFSNLKYELCPLPRTGSGRIHILNSNSLHTGQETTAITLSFTVMELGRHPEVLERYVNYRT
jgi:hypothetical protein